MYSAFQKTRLLVFKKRAIARENYHQFADSNTTPLFQTSQSVSNTALQTQSVPVWDGPFCDSSKKIVDGEAHCSVAPSRLLGGSCAGREFVGEVGGVDDDCVRDDDLTHHFKNKKHKSPFVHHQQKTSVFDDAHFGLRSSSPLGTCMDQ